MRSWARASRGVRVSAMMRRDGLSASRDRIILNYAREGVVVNGEVLEKDVESPSARRGAEERLLDRVGRRFGVLFISSHNTSASWLRGTAARTENRPASTD